MEYPAQQCVLDNRQDNALDARDSAAFSSSFQASNFSYSQAESTPAPAPQPVGQVRERKPLGGIELDVGGRMRQLSREAFGRARQFLVTQARPLERALFEHRFERAGVDGALAELARFQNEDGGFGHGNVEPI